MALQFYMIIADVKIKYNSYFAIFSQKNSMTTISNLED